MVVEEKRPISMAEVSSLVGDSEKGKMIKKFIKQFSPLSADKAKALESDLKALDLLKLKDVHITKIVDFLPRDASQLNQVLSDVSLDGDEVTKITDVVAKY